MSATVHILKDTEGRGLMALSRRLAKLNKRVLIGVPAGKSEEDGASMALVAAVNEFGSPDRGIPERPFLRAGIRENYPRITRLNVRTLREVAEGTMTADTALNLLGEVTAGGVKAKIAEGGFVANAPSTIKAKGSDKPLIDSGALRQSITYLVEDGAL